MYTVSSQLLFPVDADSGGNVSEKRQNVSSNASTNFFRIFPLSLLNVHLGKVCLFGLWGVRVYPFRNI